MLGRGKLIASPSKSTPGAGSTPTRRNTTTTTTINNNTNKNKKPLHDDDKKKTQHDEEENDEEELQEKAKEEKMKKKKKKRGGKEEAEVEKEKTTTTQTQKTKKRKREAEKRSPPKSKRKGRHLAREEEGSDDDELSREDSFDLNDFMEDLDSTMVEEEEEPHTSSTTTSGRALTEEDDFLLASAFAAAIEPKPVSSRLRPRRQDTAASAPRPKPSPRPAVTSRKRRSAEGKWSVNKLLADLVENQDADADAETGNGYDEETLAFIQQETALRQQRTQGTSDKFDRQERRLDVFPHWPWKLPATEPPSALDPDVLLPSMIDEDTWPLFLGSGECLRFVKTTRDVPESFLRWLFHITALETANEHIVWAAGKALKATATKRTAARSLWVASIRDFEDVLRWYGAADVFSSAARLDTDASVSSGAATAPDADDDSSSPEDHRSADSPERFPVANLERVLDYMARAIRHRPGEYLEHDVVAMLRWVGVLLQDRRVGSRCYASLRACLCAIFDHPVFSPADPLLFQEVELRRVMTELLVTGHGGHVPNQAVVLSLLPTAASPRVLQLRKRMALALLEDHFGATAAVVVSVLANESVPAVAGGDGGDGGGGLEEGEAEARARDEASLDRMSAMLAGVEIGADTDYALLSCMIDFIDFAAIAMSGRVLRSEAGQRLTVALKALNARIREIHGFNLAITRVKDKLIVLSGKLDQLKRLKGSSAPSPSLRSFLTCDSP